MFKHLLFFVHPGSIKFVVKLPYVGWTWRGSRILSGVDVAEEKECWDLNGGGGMQDKAGPLCRLSGICVGVLLVDLTASFLQNISRSAPRALHSLSSRPTANRSLHLLSTKISHRLEISKMAAVQGNIIYVQLNFHRSLLPQLTQEEVDQACGDCLVMARPPKVHEIIEGQFTTVEQFLQDLERTYHLPELKLLHDGGVFHWNHPIEMLRMGNVVWDIEPLRPGLVKLIPCPKCGLPRPPAAPAATGPQGQN